ncbi:MAG: DeoR/GlpR transcriptional regulator [Lentisphaerae bacterium]|nr:DeoR/GlpR transcriptional regulator [Lentisphaerota bacterium]
MNSGTIVGLAAGRQERVREIVRQRGMVTVDDLRDRLGVSAATIRRDLVELDVRGRVRRVHGGAMSVEGRLDEPVFDDKATIMAKEKQRIAEAAFKLIKPSDSVFLDGGSTILALARLLSDMHRLTVVTNSLRVAGKLAGNGPRIILTGGELRRLSQTFVGSLTRPLLERVRVDTAFMGTIGLSHEEGMSTTDPRESHTKELVMQHAGQVVLLADSSKIGTVSFVQVGTLESVNTIITDRGAKPTDVRKLRRRGLKVTLA